MRARIETNETYSEFFEKTATRLPSSIAAETGGSRLTYEELSLKARQLAAHLRSLGVGPESLVAICLERSLDFLVAVLAIWKAGGAYLPLDVSYPGERLEYMLTDSRAECLITRRGYLPRFGEKHPRAILVDDAGERARWESLPPFSGPSGAGADSLAYVIYTSGSTGLPKGVEITHRSLLNHNFSMAEIFQLEPKDRVLQFAPFSFDLSVEEIFPTWLSGAALVLRSEEASLSIGAFLDFVKARAISVLNLPTAFWHELVQHLPVRQLPPSVRLVVIGGEKASSPAFQLWKKSVPRQVRLINTYGPTETTVTATLFEADAALDSLPLGHPLPNTEIWVLDEHLNPVPDGATGELHIAGAGLARGYRGQPQLTDERFVYRFSPDAPPLRLYKTGDLARRGAGGCLEFVGRLDQQVKLRGYRIELGEIESALLACSFVKDGVVVLREDSPGKKKLVAYYVARGGAAKERKLIDFLRGRLPGYMIPSAFVRLESLPKSPAGKIDRHALPLPGRGRPALPHACIAPRNRLEEEIAGIWREVLDLNEVGVRDDFFELGGDSLLALQAASRVREKFGGSFSLAAYFEGATVEQLAVQVEKWRGRDGETSVNGEPPAQKEISAQPHSELAGRDPGQSQDFGLSLMQQQLWFLHQLSPDSDAYNIPAAQRLRGPLNVPALEAALNAIVRRHEILRATFKNFEGKPRQFISPQVTVPISLLALPGRHSRKALQALLETEVAKPFNLEEGPLLRAALIRVAPDEHVFLVVMHHIISDGWSLGLFFSELENLYNEASEGRDKAALPPPPAQYRDYIAWRDRYLETNEFQRSLEYWKATLAGAPLCVQLGKTPDRQAGKRQKAERLWFRLSEPMAARAGDFARKNKCSPFMVLLAGLATALREWSGQEDLVVGTVVAGRGKREFEETIGCFMNFLPFRLKLPAERNGADVLQSVRATVLEGQSHQECPFEKIVSAVNPERNGQRNPLFNVALLFQQFPGDGGFEPAGISAKPILVHPADNLLDLRIEVEQQEGGWLVGWEYNPDALSPDEAGELSSLFCRALKDLAEIDLTPAAAQDEPRPANRWLKGLRDSVASLTPALLRD